MKATHMIVQKAVWESGKSTLERKRNQHNADPWLLTQRCHIQVKAPAASVLH